MYPRATTGLEPNNRLFSPCSRSSIGHLVRFILESKYDRENCFLAHQDSFCGNNVREDKEQCDCGYEENDCHDQCCFARKNSHGAPGCTLRPNMQCRYGGPLPGHMQGTRSAVFVRPEEGTRRRVQPEPRLL
ncbi:disintegrin and metalloproteinase domain-containing protein 10-like [Rhipicephalus sanguineus]|uniref:disintegrin and metalloproteinase domain-containing protein 10-like n=1 Tax=Rhipicephalus sanguineus TaxID=34632 RepID=UPI0020C4F562|nr:disintegrin and metalloproteinase domain-containing protein 10-like [Rhipicephalus sanguineus]